MKVFNFKELADSDLIIDALYEGGNRGNTSDDAISKILPGSGNLGGFRFAGRGKKKKYIILYTSGEDKDWPDTFNLNIGQFIYFGDNKTPGHELHETPKGGNTVLKNIFDWLQSSTPKREMIPPIFVFKKFPTSESSRSVQFKGMVAPGFPGISSTDDLIAVWKTTENQRFQNYRAVFSLLDVPVIQRSWINDLVEVKVNPDNSPAPWKLWRDKGEYKILTSEPTTTIRSIESQTPQNSKQEKILKLIYEYFKDSPFKFEAFAAKVFQMYDTRVIVDEITRGAVDGGRDAIGRYVLGLNDDPVYVDFSLEAKCYRPPLDGKKANTVGVKEISRLISRLRHRQFGVLVTTSVIAKQAYEETREDRHPIIFICGKDITEILIEKGLNTPKLVLEVLQNEFPK